MRPKPPNPIPALERLMHEQLTVQNVVTGDLEILAGEMPASEAAERLRSLNYDLAGVHTSEGIGFVRRADLLNTKGTVADRVRPIPSNSIVEKSLPIVPMITLFNDAERYFVLDGHHVRWIVTTADLRAPAVSIAVLSYLIAFEEALRYLAIQDLGSNWFQKLGSSAQNKARTIYSDLEKFNAETGLQHCLQFSDCMTLALKASGVFAALGYPAKRKFKEECGFMPTVRNNVAHGRSILDNVGRPAEAISRVQIIRSAALAAWDAVGTHDLALESTVIVDSSDSTVDGTPGALVISAWNPGGWFKLPEQNAERHELLRSRLRAIDQTSLIEARGRSGDGAWDELGFLVTGASEQAVLGMASEFGQDSIFRFGRNGCLEVVAAGKR